MESSGTSTGGIDVGGSGGGPGAGTGPGGPDGTDVEGPGGGTGMGTGPGLALEVLRPGAEVVARGRLDARTAASARSVLQRCVDDGVGDLVLHAEGLDIWDATGLGVIVGAARRARRAGRRLVLTGVPARQLRLLRATRLDRVLVVRPTDS